MSGTEHILRVRRLYKLIFRMHRALPPELRIMGDNYARDEFKRHKKCNPDEAKVFLNEWTVRINIFFKNIRLSNNNNTITILCRIFQEVMLIVNCLDSAAVTYATSEFEILGSIPGTKCLFDLQKFVSEFGCFFCNGCLHTGVLYGRDMKSFFFVKYII